MSNPRAIVNIMNGYRKTKIMFAGVKTGIFDTLAKHPNGLTVDELAKALPGYNFQTTDGLSRLLGGCTSLNLLAVDKHKRRYSLTEDSSQYLVTSSRQSLVGYIIYGNDVLYPLWSNLESSVETGATCWTESFGYADGGNAKKAFEHMYYGDDGTKRFMRAMDGAVNNSAPIILKTVSLDWVTGLLDIGGSTGRFSSYICDTLPNCQQAIVFDLPSVVDIAEKMREEDLINDRVAFQRGSFFDGIPELPDHINAVLLSRILHDWDNTTSLELLKKIYARLASTKKETAGVVVCDLLFDDDTKSAPVDTALQDLSMMVQTGGRERSINELKSMLQEAGFKRIEVYRTGTFLDAVVGFCH